MLYIDIKEDLSIEERNVNLVFEKQVSVLLSHNSNFFLN